MRATEFTNIIDTNLEFVSISINEDNAFEYYKTKLDLNEDRFTGLYMPSHFKTSIRYLLKEGTQELDQFIDNLTSIDFKKTIKVGDLFCVLDFEFLFGFKEIKVLGFLTPKTVSEIVMHKSGKINYIKFDDGDRYPRHPPAVVAGKPVSYALYFNSTEKAQSAITFALVSKPIDWNIEIDSSLALPLLSEKNITEGLNHPVIVVDVQPEYAYFSPYFTKKCDEIVRFVCKQTGPVLMFINAEESTAYGFRSSRDTKDYIMRYWEDTILGNTDPADYYDASGVESPIDWTRFQIVDKGYGYLRSWMDHDISPNAIIKVIRLMYQNKISDSRELFGGEDSDDYEINMKALLGYDFIPMVLTDGISIKWTSVAQLKRFSGAYIVGGGRNECLREVELLMNAFNIRYKRIDSLVY